MERERRKRLTAQSQVGRGSEQDPISLVHLPPIRVFLIHNDEFLACREAGLFRRGASEVVRCRSVRGCGNNSMNRLRISLHALKERWRACGAQLFPCA